MVDGASATAFSGSLLCEGTPARPPQRLASSAVDRLTRNCVVPHSYRLCQPGNNHTLCQSIDRLAAAQFMEVAPAPPAKGLTPSDDEYVRRQFWWQWHVEAAPRRFGWVAPAAGPLAAPSRPHSELEVKALRATAGLYHSYAVGVGRVNTPGGGYVELCDRCAWDGALFIPPYERHVVDWRANPEIVIDPPKRSPDAIKPRQIRAYYSSVRRVWSYSKLLVLAQRFSGDYGHFLTELLPRLVVALPALRADPELWVLIDCSGSFVKPWLALMGGPGPNGLPPSRLVCKRRGRAPEVIHADCLAYSRFTTPFTSGWRLGLERVREAAHAAAHIEHRPAAPRQLVVWADRDLGRGSGTVHQSRDVVQAEAIVRALSSRLEGYEVRKYLGSHSSPSQTVETFAHAAAIIGPSGSAMHNTLFARPGALVVELLPEDLSYANIWQDASVLSLRYRAFHVRGFRCDTNASLEAADIERLVSHVALELRHVRQFDEALSSTWEAPHSPRMLREHAKRPSASATATARRAPHARYQPLEGRELLEGRGDCAPLPGCASVRRWLAYVPRYGLANRVLELQAAARVARLTNRSLLLPEMMPGIRWDAAFDTCAFRQQQCVVDEELGMRARALPSSLVVPAVGIHGHAGQQARHFYGRPLAVHFVPRELWKPNGRGMSTFELAQHTSAAHADAPLVVLLSVLHLRRAWSRACTGAVRVHCDTPGVGFWAPPPRHVLRFWRQMTPRATIATRVRRAVRAISSMAPHAAASPFAGEASAALVGAVPGVSNRRRHGFLGVHMRHADGSCEDRVQIWWAGKRIEPPKPRCGLVDGCTTLDHRCCDFTLVPDPTVTRAFPTPVAQDAARHCESQLADGRLVLQLARRDRMDTVFVAGDGQRPDLERALSGALARAGVRVVDNVTRTSSAKVWSSHYATARNGWTISDVEDALVDMFVLSHAHTFVANPASSFSGCVRDIRAAYDHALESTIVGVPPHTFAAPSPAAAGERDDPSSHGGAKISSHGDDSVKEL